MGIEKPYSYEPFFMRGGFLFYMVFMVYEIYYYRRTIGKNYGR